MRGSLRLLTRNMSSAASWLLVSMLLLPLWGNAQAPATAPASPSAVPAAPSTDPKARLEEIQSKRNQLAQESERIQRELDAARSKRAVKQVELLQQQAAVLQQLADIYVQQQSALENAMTLAAERRQYQEGMEKLAQTAPTEPVKFAELDRAYDELESQKARKFPLGARVKQAESQFVEAEDELKERQDALSVLEKEPEEGEAKAWLALARSQAELAQETLRLREIEQENAKQALAAYESQSEYLEKRAAQLERRAVFSKDELKNQLQDIDKEAFNLKRQLSKASELKSIISVRLAEARRRLDKAGPEDQAALTDEVEAQRLGDEAAKASVNLLSRRSELLEAWKVVWQRRHAVFNGEKKQSDWLKWKDEAAEKIDAIDEEQQLINLWLNDWQKQLVTIQNEMASLREHGSTPSHWIDLQRQNVEKIIEAYREQISFLENSRRLQQKLIDRINQRTAHRTWQEWLALGMDYEVYGNRVGHWAVAAGSAFGLFTLFVFIRNFLLKRLQAHAEEDEARVAALFFASVRRTTTFFLFMIAVFLSAFWLYLDPSSSAVLKHLTLIALIFQGAIWLSYFFSSWIRNYLGGKAKRDASSKGALSIFNFVSQAAVWSIALLLILQNIGIDVTALATGLGIGGVAVALALQRILGDLFSSLSIVLDKPFVAGDFIIFDQVLGTVEHIGIKTTRIRSLDGEQIICANSDLLETRIRNFHRMRERRVVFQIGVVYQTSAQQLARIPEILRDIVKAQPNTRFDRAHFRSYGDFALTHEVVYYVNSPDYNLYMDIQQAINIAIYERFQAEGIEFAYPTQSLIVQGFSRGDARLERGKAADALVPQMNRPP